jgi:hypothetical protein
VDAITWWVAWMIDEWPRDLIQLLVDPKPSEPVAIWIGAGLGAELGYVLTTPLVERLIRECVRAGCAPGDIQQAQDLLYKKHDYRMAAEECWRVLNNPALFRALLVEEFSQRSENQTGLRACEAILRIPFDTYVTTNYNISLSTVAQDLAKRDGVYAMAPDVVYPNLTPSNLRERCIHYIHSNVTQVDSIVLRESTFLDAYKESSSLTLFLQDFFATHNVLFFGTDARDEDIMWILHRMRRIFPGTYPAVPLKCSYVLLPIPEKGVPTGHPLDSLYGIRPLWFSVKYRRIETEEGTVNVITDRGNLYEMLGRLQKQTETRWRGARAMLTDVAATEAY